MATITLKNIPDKLLLKLKEEAKSHQRSLNREIIFALQGYLLQKQDRPTAEEIIDRARSLRDKFTFTVTEEEIDSAKKLGRS